MYADTVLCHKPNYKKRWKVFIEEEERDNIKEWTGQSLSSLLRFADDWSWWAAIIIEASPKYSFDVWASQDYSVSHEKGTSVTLSVTVPNLVWLNFTIQFTYIFFFKTIIAIPAKKLAYVGKWQLSKTASYLFLIITNLTVKNMMLLP